jgi:transposase-like protein
MSNEKKYSIIEVCEEIGISIHTLKKWYQWQSYELKDGSITEPYLPIPERLAGFRGRPQMWTKKQVEQLRKHKESIVMGRNGKWGRYSNPLYMKKGDK